MSLGLIRVSGLGLDLIRVGGFGWTNGFGLILPSLTDINQIQDLNIDKL